MTACTALDTLHACTSTVTSDRRLECQARESISQLPYQTTRPSPDEKKNQPPMKRIAEPSQEAQPKQPAARPEEYIPGQLHLDPVFGPRLAALNRFISGTGTLDELGGFQTSSFLSDNAGTSSNRVGLIVKSEDSQNNENLQWPLSYSPAAVFQSSGVPWRPYGDSDISSAANITTATPVRHDTSQPSNVHHSQAIPLMGIKFSYPYGLGDATLPLSMAFQHQYGNESAPIVHWSPRQSTLSSSEVPGYELTNPDAGSAGCMPSSQNAQRSDAALASPYGSAENELAVSRAQSSNSTMEFRYPYNRWGTPAGPLPFAQEQVEAAPRQSLRNDNFSLARYGPPGCGMQLSSAPETLRYSLRDDVVSSTESAAIGLDPPPSTASEYPCGTRPAHHAAYRPSGYGTAAATLASNATEILRGQEYGSFEAPLDSLDQPLDATGYPNSSSGLADRHLALGFPDQAFVFQDSTATAVVSAGPASNPLRCAHGSSCALPQFPGDDSGLVDTFEKFSSFILAMRARGTEDLNDADHLMTGSAPESEAVETIHDRSSFFDM